jgi:chaperone LolA
MNNIITQSNKKKCIPDAIPISRVKREGKLFAGMASGVIIFLIIILVNSLNAQDNGKELLSTVQKKYKSINDLTADFRQSINSKSNVTGKIQYSRGNKLRLELKNLIIISDGSNLWNYNKSQKKVVISRVSPDDPSFFSPDKFISGYPSKSDVTTEKEEGYDLLVLVPRKESNLDFKKVKIWLDHEYLMTRILVENLSGAIMDFQLSNYKLNQNLPDTKFTFIPPEGTNIIDLRK